LHYKVIPTKPRLSSHIDQANIKAVAKIMDYEAEVISADTGLPVDTQTVETPTEVEQVEADNYESEDTEQTTETKVETPTDDNLVELPDGRKLPPKEAEAEYRNLYSEFTRRSQRLADYEKSDKGEINNSNQTIENEEWVPQTWDEVLEKAAQLAEQKTQSKAQAEIEARQQTEAYVSTQLEDLKKDNPTLNENQLFNHALKYNFTDLKVAYSNMKDMQSSIQKATELTAKNIQKRNADPISGGSQGGAISDGDVYDPSARNISLVDYLNSIK